MYRGSNERFSENANIQPMNPYPPPPPNINPHHSMTNPYPGPIPPIYYQPIPNYDYLPSNNNNNPPDYDRNYNQPWRETSQSKGPMPLNNNMGPSPIQNPPNIPSHFEGRPMASGGGHGDFPPGKQLGEPYMIQTNSQVNPPVNVNVNVVQRISGLIKSQLNQLQAILSYADKKTQEQRIKKDRDRSRSRSREKNDRSKKQHREWNCSKCSYLNFDFRDRCKKCNEQKPEARSERDRDRDRDREGSQTGKIYVPGPDDWRCAKCNNINYARRTECHRCHTIRNK